MLREGALLVAEVPIVEAQGGPVEVTGMRVCKVNRHVVLSRNDRNDCHLAVQADSDSCTLLSFLQVSQQTLLQGLVAVVLVVNLLGEDLEVLLVLPGLTLETLVFKQSQDRFEHLADLAALDLVDLGLVVHGEVVEVLVELVLVVEHVGHHGGHGNER